MDDTKKIKKKIGPIDLGLNNSIAKSLSNSELSLSNSELNNPKNFSIDTSSIENKSNEPIPAEENTKKYEEALSNIKKYAREGRFVIKSFNEARILANYLENPPNILYDSLFEPLEKRVKSVPLTAKLVKDIQNAINFYKDQSFIKRAERLARMLSAFEGRSMNDDDYQILLKAFTYDFINLDEIIEADKSRDYFNKASCFLSNASSIIRNYDGSSDKIRNIVGGEKNQKKIKGYYEKIREDLRKIGLFDVLKACESVIHRQLNKKNIPNQLAGLVSRCGYEIPEIAIISGIAAGKYLWPRHTPEETFDEIEGKIKKLDETFIHLENSKRIPRKPLVGLGKIFMGGATIAANVALTADALKRSPQNSTDETVSSLIVCVCMGLNFMWLGLDD